MKLTLIIATIAAISFAGCTKKIEPQKTSSLKIDSKGILADESLSDSEKAEKLALAAEQLAGSSSFIYADTVAESALLIDPDNKRAQLVRVLLSPAISMKGILERIKPLANRDEENKAAYQRYLDYMLKEPNHALKTFLFEGQQDIKSESDIQSFFGEITTSFDNIRTFFKNNKDLEITLNAPGDQLQRDLVDDAKYKCDWVEVSEGIYERDCDLSSILQFKVGRAEIEGMQQIAAGYQIYFSLINAYSYDGSIAFADKTKGMEVSSKETLDELLSVPAFGTLRDAKGLNSIISMGIDAISGIRWAKSLSEELCPTGQETPSSRPGFLLDRGLCIEEPSDPTTSVDEIMETVEIALTGGLIDAVFKGVQGEYSTKVRPKSFLEGSISDIRSLGLIYDDCDQLISIGDSSVGGVFVNRDVNAANSVHRTRCYQ